MYIDVDELTTVARTKIRLTIVAESIADNVAMPVLMSSALSCIVALTSSVISEYVSLLAVGVRIFGQNAGRFFGRGVRGPVW